MYQVFSRIALSLSLFTTTIHFCAEPQPQEKHLSLLQQYNSHKYINREFIRGVAHGNTLLMQNHQGVTKSGDLFYLLRPASIADKPHHLVSLCPYTIADLHEDKDVRNETFAFLKKNWPEDRSPANIIRKPTLLLLACIENNSKTIERLLKNLDEIQKNDPETLKDCLFLAIEHNRYNDDTSVIYTLFMHPYINNTFLQKDFEEYMNFAMNPAETNKYVTTNFAVKALKEIQEFLQYSEQKTTPKQQSYIARIGTTVTRTLSRTKTESKK